MIINNFKALNCVMSRFSTKETNYMGFEIVSRLRLLLIFLAMMTGDDEQRGSRSDGTEFTRRDHS